ncbi:ABC transporter ATP-binding protein [Marinivivus vitaminiproducens]|uniref:ABC transporter ATP-binding protein n=1 Tax=Marinivivus vitaminiproducens TaxID=3035935 RepID=UPI0027A6483B|nr:ABC transporter ATP-binding protein [Geminicoccaceae bacterium SCSIO 64248]
MTDTSSPLVQVRNLRVAFPSDHGWQEAVRGVSFDLGREKLGIVGESGSGKSLTGRSIMRLLPSSACATADRLSFHDIDLLHAPERTMVHVRGRRIGLIMQDPKYSLNPVVTVGEQIAEAFRLHHGGKGAKAKAIEMLTAVRLREPERVYKLYPHEVSGGMGQRIMIAMMLVSGPEVLIADEPTSALDVTVRMEVLQLLDGLVKARGLGLIFISHDLNLVRRFCDRVLIMYAGRVLEELPASELDRAQHPYTKGLLASLPRIHDRRERLAVLRREESWRQAEPEAVS